MENIKAVWRYYLLAFSGLGLLWLAQKVSAPISTLFTAMGAIGFLAGVLLTLYWDRKRKREQDEEDSKL